MTSREKKLKSPKKTEPGFLFTMNILSKNSTEYLELRKAKFIYFFITFILLLALIVNVADKQKRADLISSFYPDFTWYSLVILLIVFSIIIYIVFNLLDRKVKLKISEEGIWTKKFGGIAWKEIWYVATEESKSSNGKPLSLTIKLKQDQEENTEREYVVQLAGLNYDLKNLWKVMNYYCEKYEIINLGHNYIKIQ